MGLMGLSPCKECGCGGCHAHLVFEPLEGDEISYKLGFTAADQTFRSAEVEDAPSWKVVKHYDSLTVEMTLDGVVISEDKFLGPALPTWDAEIEFEGIGTVRATRSGDCTYNTAKVIDPCTSAAQTGEITYRVYKESNKELVAELTSASDGKAMIIGLEEEEDYRIVAEKSNCGFGSVLVEDLEFGEDYTVPLGCLQRQTVICSSSCTPLGGPPWDWPTVLPGTRITVSGPNGFWLTGTTGGDGRFYWFPPTAGTYTITVQHPSGRFVDFVRTGRVGFCGGSAPSGPGSVLSGNFFMTPRPGYSCCASGVLRSAMPIKLPLTCTTDTGTTWEQGSPTGNSCSGSAIKPVLVDRMGPNSFKHIPCPPPNDWCPGTTKEPDGLAAGMITMWLGVNINNLVPTNTVPQGITGSVSAQYGAAWTSVSWKVDESCPQVCFGLPADRIGSAWWYDDPNINGGGQFGDGWVLMSASPFHARVFFISPEIASYYWHQFANGTNDGKSPLPRAIKYIDVKEAG